MDCRFLRHRRRKRDASGEAGWDVQTSWPILSAFEPPETRKKKTVPRRNANIRISGCLRKQGVIYIEKHGGDEVRFGLDFETSPIIHSLIRANRSQSLASPRGV